MLGPTFFDDKTGFKKDYKFVWNIFPVNTAGIKITADGLGSGVGIDKITGGINTTITNIVNKFKNAFNSIKNSDYVSSFWHGSQIDNVMETIIQNATICSYISQFADSITLPQDELEVEQYQYGMFTYPVPKNLKMSNIQVTYYDDSNDSIYNFHKTWLQHIIPQTDTGEKYPSMNPFDLVLSAELIYYENELDATDYATITASNMVNQLFGTLSSRASSIIKNGLTRDVLSTIVGTTFGKLSDVHDNDYNNPSKDDIFITEKSKYTYSQIYPVSISRSNPQKSASSLHKVTVTYTRIPKISGIKPPLSSNNTYGIAETNKIGTSYSGNPLFD